MKVIHTVPHLITPINDVKFTALDRPEGGSISEEISQEQVDVFLQIPTFELYVDPEAAPADPVKPAQETAAQRKARLAAEKQAAEDKAAADKAATEKAEAERLAAEEADRLAAETAAQQSTQDSAPAEGSENEDSGEVF